MEIAGELSGHGYPKSSNDCRKKWSNLIRTFKVIFETKNDPASTKRSRWTFYDKLSESLLSSVGEYLPESSSLVSLMKHPAINRLNEMVDAQVTSIALQDDPAVVPTTMLIQSRVDEQDVQLQTFMSSEVMAGDFGADIEVLTHPSSQVSTSAQELIQIHSQHPFDPHDLLSRVVTAEHLTSPTSSVMISAPALPPLEVSLLHHDQSKPPKTPPRRPRRKMKTKTGGDDGVAQLISITLEHNEKVLAQMKQFHEDAISVMRERNKTLNNLCDFLKRS